MDNNNNFFVEGYCLLFAKTFWDRNYNKLKPVMAAFTKIYIKY